MVAPRRILAISPYYRGFGFVVVGTDRRLIGYGMKRSGRTDKRERFIQQVTQLMQYYQPTAIVVEDWTAPECRRARWICELLQELRELATHEQIPLQRFSRSEVKATIVPHRKRVTKHQVARVLVSLYPELAHKQPPVRKPWMGEDTRMSLFDALALAVVLAVETHKGRGSRPGRG